MGVFNVIHMRHLLFSFSVNLAQGSPLTALKKQVC